MNFPKTNLDSLLVPTPPVSVYRIAASRAVTTEDGHRSIVHGSVAVVDGTVIDETFEPEGAV